MSPSLLTQPLEDRGERGQSKKPGVDRIEKPRSPSSIRCRKVDGCRGEKIQVVDDVKSFSGSRQCEDGVDYFLTKLRADLQLDLQFALKNVIFNVHLPIFVSYVLAISFIYLLNLFSRFPVPFLLFVRLSVSVL